MFSLLPTRVHGFLDHVLGVMLIAVPLAFGFGAGAQTWLPVLLGAGLILYSLFTEYELGVVPLIRMPSHLVTDGLVGLLLIASPWIFGFAWEIWVPHVVLGLAQVGAAMCTQTKPWPDMQPTLQFRPVPGDQSATELRATA
jgi:SPW repeat